MDLTNLHALLNAQKALWQRIDFASTRIQAAKYPSLLPYRRIGDVQFSHKTGTACRAPTAARFVWRNLLWLLREWRRRDVLFEVAQQEGVEVERGVWAFVYGVGTVGVFHEVYGLVEFDQAV